MDIIEAVGKAKAVVRIGNTMAGKAAITRKPGKERSIAEIFTMTGAIVACAASLAEPWYSYPLSDCEGGHVGPDLRNFADDLVPRYNGQPVANVPIHHVQVGAAHAACGYGDKDFSRPRLRDWSACRPERLARRIKLHGTHG
ncbi:hypothetical protein J2X73_001282 [Novosphingobium sp. 1748]|nr:hypothetical protein [Novosphingobium sp. 1748]